MPSEVIVGLSVPNVRSHFDALLKGDYSAVRETSTSDVKETEIDAAKTVPVEATASVDEDSRSMRLKAFVSGDLVDISEVPDDAFSQMMMGDGVAIKPPAIRLSLRQTASCR